MFLSLGLFKIFSLIIGFQQCNHSEFWCDFLCDYLSWCLCFLEQGADIFHQIWKKISGIISPNIYSFPLYPINPITHMLYHLILMVSQRSLSPCSFFKNLNPHFTSPQISILTLLIQFVESTYLPVFL